MSLSKRSILLPTLAVSMASLFPAMDALSDDTQYQHNVRLVLQITVDGENTGHKNSQGRKKYVSLAQGHYLPLIYRYLMWIVMHPVVSAVSMGFWFLVSGFRCRW